MTRTERAPSESKSLYIRPVTSKPFNHQQWLQGVNVSERPSVTAGDGWKAGWLITFTIPLPSPSSRGASVTSERGGWRWRGSLTPSPVASHDTTLRKEPEWLTDRGSWWTRLTHAHFHSHSPTLHARPSLSLPVESLHYARSSPVRYI